MTGARFDQIIDRTGTHSYKWDDVGEVFGSNELLPMWVADMDFQSPDSVIEAVVERAQHGVYGYAGDFDGYFNSVKDWFNKRFNCKIEKDWIKTTPGVVPALNMAVRTYTNPGDKVIIQSPVYPPFFNVVRNNGCHVINNELIEEKGKYYIDFEDLDKKASDSRAKILMLCSPHNPVGRVWSREELKKIGEICQKNNLILISDEIHGDLTFPGNNNIPYFKIMSELNFNNVILCTSPAKTFNVAGLQTSSVIIPDQCLRSSFNNTLEANGFSKPNIFGLIAAESCYNYGEDWLDELREYLYQNFLFIEDYLKNNIPALEVTKSQGTYLAWLDIRKTGKTTKEIQKLLVSQGKVALIPGTKFGPNGEGFLRLNFGCPQKQLHQGLDRIAKVINSL
ncbi:MalY/PatB family protein [Natranaerobius thermophilus]|uniref:cysteine-S-conjugate beta-lyase n=1 Tax=Natranaerobius thermophilus (strain ATCC BAA-1301 / DSM 18059 / JW/NM-WN-LF) TaxID=457570 RepID=B2A4W5_NATTJ|nr:MalY/PatB family protein [Natranaerobius thermophilus]ACB83887.1 aminotransferase class I and II [Natranaerobius thermophilus JW/NM-WN-LF]